MNTRLSVVCILLAGLLLPVQSVAQTVDGAGVMKALLGDFIRPGYRNFKAKSTDLESKANELCDSPDPERLRAAQSAFSDLVEAWSGIEVIRFGPISQFNRFERTLFYPDRKSTGLKQVQRLLVEEDPSATDVTSLSGKSVAVQGLGAAEFLLFGTGHETLADGNLYRCDYLLAVAGNLRSIANELVIEWNPGSEAKSIWTMPGANNPVLKDNREAVNEVLGTIVHGLESVRDIRIGAFLRSEPSKDKPRLAIFRRSENTLRSISGNLDAIDKLIDAAELGSLVDAEGQVYLKNIRFDLQNAVRTLRGLPSEFTGLLNDPVAREKIVYVRTAVGFAIKTADQDFARSAGLSSGFSFSDGD